MASSSSSDTDSGSGLSLGERRSTTRDQQVGDAAHFILAQNSKKGWVSFRDIRTASLSPGVSRQEALDIVKAAGERLKFLFGFELAEIESKKDKAYFLKNTLILDEDGTNREHQGVRLLKYEEEDLAKKGLLTAVLTYLFMSDPGSCVAQESNLWKFLRRLGVDKTETHPVLGKPQDLFKEWREQGWLERAEIVYTEPREYEYQWGARARGTVSKRDLLSFACVVDGASPTDWTMHYEVVAEEED